MRSTGVRIGARWALAALALLLTAFTGIASADPPTRVMRLANLSGAVSFSAAGSDDWVFAPINRPIVYGDRLWADADGRAEVELGNGTAWLGPHTSLRVLNLDDDVVQLEVTQGTVLLRVRQLDSNDTVEIDTPNLAFVVTRPGRYRIAVDDRGDATLVAVRDGMGEVYGGRSSYVVTRNQTYRFYGTDLTDSEFLAAPPIDGLERYAEDRARRFDRAASARYVSTQVVGYADLDTYGSWSSVPEYGNVWFPREVPADWAPYRYGHWSWIDPWGWTWVDDAPWGFAPFHYGRWAHVSRGWCWVPGPTNVRPVYAPALVAFVGGGNVSVSVSSGPAIGWFPLAPREVYRPWYTTSPTYARQVNVSNTQITNVTVINNIVNNPATVTQVNQYVNLRVPNAVTAVPPAAMAQSQPVQRAVVDVRQTLDRSHVTAVVAVAPAHQALVGATKPAQAKPPAPAETRQVVAKTPPPPAPMPVAEKLPMLQKDPSKPIEKPRAQAAAPAAAPAAPQAGAPARPGAAPAAPATAVEPGKAPPPNVRVVQAAKPAATAAPPAKAPDASRAAAPRGEERAAPAAGQLGAPAEPSKVQPPAAQPPVAQPPAAQPSTAQPPGRPGMAAQPPREETRTGQPPREEPKAPAPPAPRAIEEPKAPAAVPPGLRGREEGKAPTPPGQAQERRVTPPGRAPETAAPPPPAGRPAPAPTPEAARPAPAPEAARPAPAPSPAQPEAARREAPRPPEAAPTPPAAASRPAPVERSAQEPARATPPQPAPPQAAPSRIPEAQRAAPPPEAPRAAPPRPPEARPAPPAAETRQAAPPPPKAPPEAKSTPPEAKSAPPAAQARPPEQRGNGHPPEKGKDREKDKEKDNKDRKD